MNEVDVLNLKEEIGKYNSLIDEYQENYLNVYNEIKNSNMYWVDPQALLFFESKELEKNKIDVSLEELKSIKNIYDLIVSQYERLGNNIKFDLSKRDIILSKLNVYINKLNRIITLYNSLDISYASPSIRTSINNQIASVKSMINVANSVRKNIKDIFDKIVESEDKIRKAIANIQIEVLPASTTERFI
ncbi:MAG: hypothetical protein IJ572_03260 [Bacilli bacterium]|nr:hypothetical protein [Bacilli bacterium]